MQYKNVTHVLFDLDGLLLGKYDIFYSRAVLFQNFNNTSQLYILLADSEILYTETFTTVCAKYGKTFTWEIKASLLGFQGHECAEKIVKELDLPITKDEFQKECFELYEVLFPNVQLMPGKIILINKIM